MRLRVASGNAGDSGTREGRHGAVVELPAMNTVVTSIDLMPEAN